MNTDLVIAGCLGVALSACCGFRVFVPLLVAGLAARLGWLSPVEGMAWLGSWPALICFGVAAGVEILAYYVPVVDHALDTLAAPLAVGAGTLLSAALLPVSGAESEWLRWVLGLLSGGAAAGTIQLGTGLIRLFSGKTTATAGNAVVATGENVMALGGSLLSLWAPVLMTLLFVGLVFWILRQFFRRKPRNN